MFASTQQRAEGEAMTTRILQINASLFGEQGQSSQLNAYLVERLSAHGHSVVTKRDLAAQPLPHLSGDTLAAIGTSPDARTSEQANSAALADAVIDELKAADVLVLAAPMYNFNVPSTVKAWMDYVARAGVTFQYTADGPQGLLSGKTAYITATRGGIHRGKPSDTQTDFVTTFLNFIGITDIHWVYAEGINMGDHKETALASAKATIDQLVSVKE
ncbi:FMN-dependent NADH-azoreductase [Marinagarivorans cellulosilyticus]|uniref:FMN dependent NADH:quinone oxidoreductase n=2 Tax=Marinagarivorans cellulosilyticus TaxID=2721545 RepID=A0AAN1WF29_9GAMM|nr:FMN-dependent NADH-azoreductase [Marinagarivorans cellulosilyticus]